MTAPDGRPCTMEAYVTALFQEVPSEALLRGSIRAWIRGDFTAALRPLPDHARQRLTGEGEAACLSLEEMKAQASRCNCRGADDYCPCQNAPDRETRRQRLIAQKGGDA
ncbi:hypothetical protein [Martelella soudanensis]|uniref:hypothetical protein n=1 Tax=Martelella sp. NC20 TaxID=2740298 RepID=UPI0015DF6482|nr:hypothetical protein [Martelella sp. NC20]